VVHFVFLAKSSLETTNALELLMANGFPKALAFISAGDESWPIVSVAGCETGWEGSSHKSESRPLAVFRVGPVPPH
jgi:hypothetical protein